MLRMTLGFAFGVACLLTFGGDAAARNECVAQAGAEFKACSTECKETRRNDVAICRGHDAVCAVEVVEQAVQGRIERAAEQADDHVHVERWRATDRGHRGEGNTRPAAPPRPSDICRKAHAAPET